MLCGSRRTPVAAAQNLAAIPQATRHAVGRMDNGRDGSIQCHLQRPDAVMEVLSDSFMRLHNTSRPCSGSHLEGISYPLNAALTLYGNDIEATGGVRRMHQ